MNDIRPVMPSLELLNRLAEVAEACAEGVSSLSPERRTPMLLRDTAERAKELIDAIENHPGRILDACGRLANSCDRCVIQCKDSMYSCCRTTASLASSIGSLCRHFLDHTFSPPRAA